MKKFINKTIFLILIFTCLSIKLNAQTDPISGGGSTGGGTGGGGGGYESSEPQEYFNVEFQPAPSSATFENYFDKEYVNLYTGTPVFSIPIYTIDNAKYKHYISVQYSSNGVEKNEMERPGKLGLSWSLNAGGVINRTIKNNPDDHSNGFMHNSQYAKMEYNEGGIIDYNFFFNYDQDQLDPEPDVFSYSFGEYSGKFYIKPYVQYNQVIGPEKIVLIPKQNIKILAYTDDYSGQLSKFVITTPDGIQYTFDLFETTSNWNPRTKQTITYRSAWFLTQIKSPENNIEYTLTYLSKTFDYDRIWSKSQKYKDANDINNNYLKDGGIIPSSQTETVNSFYIQKITGRDKAVIFTYNDKLLSSISIYKKSNLNTPLKTFQFNYFDIILTQITEQCGSESLPPYIFEYNDLLYFGYLPVDYGNSVDLWGYFNGQSNESLLPNLNYDSFDFRNLGGLAERNHNLLFNKFFMLNKITMPTGGSVVYNYESHKFKDPGGMHLRYYLNCVPGTDTIIGGGVRVSDIKLYDENNIQKLYKKFNYEDGMIFNFPDFFSVSYGFEKEINWTFWEGTKYIYISSDANSSFGTSGGSKIGYSRVSEKIIGTENNGKIIHEYRNDNDNPGWVYNYSGPVDFNIDLSHKRSYEEKMYVKKMVNGIEQNSLYNDKQFFQGISGINNNLYGAKMVRNFPHGYTPNDIFSTEFSYSLFKYESVWNASPILINEYSYDDSGNPLLNSKTFDYDTHTITINDRTYELLLLNNLTEFMQSQESVLFKKYTYNLSNSQMTNKFMITPVTIKSFKGPSDINYPQISGINTTFSDLFGSIQARYINIFNTVTNNYEINAEAISYDTYGNLTCFKQKDDINKIIIWGENFTLPIAEIQTNEISYNNVKNILESLNYPISELQDATPLVLETAFSELRNYFITNHIDAQMTTYIYNDFGRIISISDINNKKTSYEYDALYRLKLVRNHNGSIIEAFEYNFREN